jgi:hypothetical protein
MVRLRPRESRGFFEGTTTSPDNMGWQWVTHGEKISGKIPCFS